ncbi:MAG: DUF2946 domain-containing protein [Burkholderiaceae bacterium]|nr:DUF2946 domain-containing protein [Burkholderiaceae bacterium]
MNFFRPRLQLVLCIALIAMLGLALVPTLSRLMIPSTGSGPWSEICSTVGARWLASATPSTTDPTQTPVAPGKARVAHMEHCPLCSHLSPVPDLLPSDAAVVLLAACADYLPALYTQAPRTLYAWAAVQARAPPLL